LRAFPSTTSPPLDPQTKKALRDAGVKVVTPQEVSFVQRGTSSGGGPAAAETVIIDVRPEGLHRAGHLRGAVNVPYYRPIEGWAPWQIARRIGYAAFGVFNGTEVNPNFAAEVEAAVGGDKARPVVLFCSQGGSLEATASRARGFQTRCAFAFCFLYLLSCV
jgi:rhodanese-related sulfurtransferase